MVFYFLRRQAVGFVLRVQFVVAVRGFAPHELRDNISIENNHNWHFSQSEAVLAPVPEEVSQVPRHRSV